MKRVDTAGSVSNLFSDGDISNGEQPTIVDASWCNAVQEEISRTIESAGASLDATRYDQLYNAIQSMISSSFTPLEARVRVLEANLRPRIVINKAIHIVHLGGRDNPGNGTIKTRRIFEYIDYEVSLTGTTLPRTNPDDLWFCVIEDFPEMDEIKRRFNAGKPLLAAAQITYDYLDSSGNPKTETKVEAVEIVPFGSLLPVGSFDPDKDIEILVGPIYRFGGTDWQVRVVSLRVVADTTEIL